MATTDFIAVIELSSSKLSGIAGRKNSDGSLQVLAYATEGASPFVHKGIIYNIDKTALALENIIKRLESQLGKSIAKVYAGISGQSLRTISNSVSRTLNEEGVISQELVDSLCDENRNVPLGDMTVLDVAPQEYRIDNTLQADPVGVAGQNITGQFLNIVARNALKKNMELSFEQAGIETADDFIVAPLALARAVLTDNERRSGCALIDFGADTTTVMVYKNNLLRFLSVLPLGGNNITRDITSLQMEEQQAELLKLHYGDALYEEEEETNKGVTCSTEDGRTIELAKLNEIIGARTEEILANVWKQLQLSGYETALFSGVILTGGGANLKNIEEAFRKVSKIDKIKTAKYVQLSVKDETHLLAENGRQNTLIGLLDWGRENCCKPDLEEKPTVQQPAVEPENIFKDDENWKKLEEEALRKQARIEKEDKARKDKERKEKERLERETKKKEKGPGWFARTIEKFSTEIFSDEEMKDAEK